MKYYVYILKSIRDDKFYTGITNNLVKRIGQHNSGDKATPSTLNRGPFKLVHSEELNTRVEARVREKYWKSGSGRELRDLMTV